MSSNLDRRSFVGSAAATSAFTIVPRAVLGGTGYVAPSDKLTLAHIGMGTQSFTELGGLLANPKIQIVAVCDPNRASNNYVEWGKGSIRNTIRRILDQPDWQAGETGCPGGRDIGKEVIDAYYAKQRATDQFRSVTAYADFRELLDKERDIDAVKIMTPDHLHATVSIAAMKRGKHVVVHKPLANRMYEARLVIETARKTGCATHFLPYGAGDGNRRICARINEGAIGTLREIHNWSNRPVWPQYTEIPKDSPAPPPGFDWDLWLGPALERPYHPNYTNAVFRGWYDFGGGSMADMGIYSLWPVFTELNLPSPVSADAWATHTNIIEEQVSKRNKNDFAFPTACTIHFTFPSRGGSPAPELFWYDGGIKPRLPAELEAANIEWPIEGILFVGDQGKIFAGFNGQMPQVAAKGKIEPLFPGEAPPRRDGGQAERVNVWLPSFLGGPPSPGNFLNAAGISDAVTLGTVSLRAGRKVLLDSENMKITNLPEANRFLYREYRKGWEL
ncbi:Gfo/Idh/MocA family oxidoreductase [uncultured Paludibaculum sp.]|uniref:Gfo/Idh/MocA family protein n=1 Tax=uncultured Paludibaculum sp. TaxID=1765020 RepID=UPI002AAB8267|nr:Gfo/Idh/MocA family oxidoreductase [uncultured Paludibaculum sp.]